MFHEFEPVFDNSYRDAAPRPGSPVLYFTKDTVLVMDRGPLSYPAYPHIPPHTGRFIYLFSLGGSPYFLADGWQGEIATGLRAIPISSLRCPPSRDLAFAGVTGYQLFQWYCARRYCGACGARTELDSRERMIFCPACGQKEYPSIMPAVIVGVHDGDRLLLTQYAGRTSTRWALVAGFSEIGEPLEQTVRREVFEETGLQVKNILYYKSQPWPFSGSLLAGFFAALEGSPDVKIDGIELDKAVWMTREEIPVVFDGCSLTNEMICQFKKAGANGIQQP